MEVYPTSDAVIKTVARKLRHYMDFQRREQEFDLSGPKKPSSPFKRQEFQKSVSRIFHTHHDGHHLRQPHVKRQQSQSFQDNESVASSRQSSVRLGLEDEMDRLALIRGMKGSKSKTGRRNFAGTSTTNKPIKRAHSAQSAQSTPRPILSRRQSCLNRLSRGEAERLLSSASRLLVATEMIALGEEEDHQAASNEVRLPTVEMDSSWCKSPEMTQQDVHLEDVNGYQPNQNETKPPKVHTDSSEKKPWIEIKLQEASRYSRSDSFLQRKAGSILPPHRRRRSSKDSVTSHDSVTHWRSSKDSVTSHDSVTHSNERNESGLVTVTAVSSLTDVNQVDESDGEPKLNDGRREEAPNEEVKDGGLGEMLEDKQIEQVINDSGSKLEEGTEKEEKNEKEEPTDNKGIGLQEEITSPTPEAAPESLPQTPAIAMVNSFTQTPNHKSTQTINSFVDAPVGDTELLASSTPEKVLHEASRVLQLLQDLPTKVQYQLEVHTGSESSAGTTASVFVNIYGETGNSGPRELTSNKNEQFQPGKVDFFTVFASPLGKLKGVKIWHDNGGASPDWFLEKVIVREGKDEIADFVFDCKKWLKSPSNADASYKPYEALYPTEIVLKGVASSELEAVLLGSSTNHTHSDHQLSSGGYSYGHPGLVFQPRQDSRSWSDFTRDGHGPGLEAHIQQTEWSQENSLEKSHSHNESEKTEAGKGDMSAPPSQQRMKEQEKEEEQKESLDVKKTLEKIDEEARQEALLRHTSAMKIQEFLKGFSAGSKALKADPKSVEKKLQEMLNEEEKEKEEEDETEEEEEEEDEEQQLLSMLSSAKKGDVRQLERLLNLNSFLLQAKDEHGRSPLHESASGGHTECVKFLVSQGADLYEFTPTGYCPIHLATMNGHIHCLQLMKGLGCGLSLRDVDDKTPLHLAAERGFCECCRWLIANRANLNVEDKSGRTPVDLAEENGQEECAKLLLECGKELQREGSGLALVISPEKGKSPTPDLAGSLDRSHEEVWVSDDENDVVGEVLIGAAPSLEQKRVLYERQQKMMKRRQSSFLDSIRHEVEEDLEEEEDGQGEEEVSKDVESGNESVPDEKNEAVRAEQINQEEMETQEEQRQEIKSSKDKPENDRKDNEEASFWD